jgi:hypothetical protein
LVKIQGGARRIKKRATKKFARLDPDRNPNLTADDIAIRMRQGQVFRRYLAGGAAVGGLGFYTNRDGSRGGYRYMAPRISTPKGTGRYS